MQNPNSLSRNLIPALAFSVTALAGCTSEAPTTITTESKTSCTIDEERTADHGSLVLDCSGVPEETIRRAYKNQTPLSVTGIGKCTVILAFTEPRESSDISSIFANGCLVDPPAVTQNT